MRFTLDFDMDNAAFDTSENTVANVAEVTRILRKLAALLDGADVLTDQNGGTLRDSNGNSVGSWGVSA